MNPLVVHAHRVLSAEEATELVGHTVPDGGDPVPGAEEDRPTIVRDTTTDETVVIITRLDRERAGDLRHAVLQVGNWTGVARSKGGPGLARMSYTDSRTFGYTPKKVQIKREACGEATIRRDYPDTATVLADLAGYLSDQFREMMPGRAAADADLVHQIKDDWLLAGSALWTSGVINRTATLPYHRDGSNFRTWSAMPSLRYRTTGGQLRIPEYGLRLPIRDGEVSWFCGKDLVHGVTPLHVTRDDGYRFTIVYYALRGLVDCRTWAEETADKTRLRTVRERKMADELP